MVHTIDTIHYFFWGHKSNRIALILDTLSYIWHKSSSTAQRYLITTLICVTKKNKREKVSISQTWIWSTRCPCDHHWLHLLLVVNFCVASFGVCSHHIPQPLPSLPVDYISHLWCGSFYSVSIKKTALYKGENS